MMTNQINLERLAVKQLFFFFKFILNAFVL